ATCLSSERRRAERRRTQQVERRRGLSRARVDFGERRTSVSDESFVDAERVGERTVERIAHRRRAPATARRGRDGLASALSGIRYLHRAAVVPARRGTVRPDDRADYGGTVGA